MNVFNYIRRGLFEADKLTVAALLAFKVQINESKIQQDELDFLINGSSSSIDAGNMNMGPLQEWMPDAIWAKVKALESMPRFKGIGDAMQSESDEWQAWFDIEKVDTMITTLFPAAAVGSPFDLGGLGALSTDRPELSRPELRDVFDSYVQTYHTDSPKNHFFHHS